VTYRVLIADDEPLARRGVKARLQASPAFAVACECETGDEALAAIDRVKPDLVFLDIEMPGLSGLEVAGTVAGPESPAVIFTTAYDQYALPAFEARAIDYLLKPLDDTRFAQALERASRFLQGGGSGVAPPLPLERGPEIERFWVKSRGRLTLVPAREVDWIAAEGDYARLHVGERSYLINDSLTTLEGRLAWAGFARIHRSTIVNLARVAELRPHMNQDHTVHLTTGPDLRLSRTYYQRVMRLLR
jgi:two-component system, LytTR family, response regulator